ncbi:MAG: shikimate dehydrogenase [Martelella sp.]|uniref:shikimate dehydrogenase n=1 Tax=unclassified Martelella TaxID=2629616 RepID=UPI000C4168C1|nr:shikimate dehydrogenase [Martelella sp.]MAU20811.1 shikimate dehydrogenase [Martelella sp.]|tara:strand:- start:483 stop:1388 length:906 start_codon:yes stop_codon:yes gene_type:complete
MVVTQARSPRAGSGQALRVGLLGQGIGGSRTPGMHMAAAGALGLDYQYDFIDVLERDLPPTIGETLDLLQAEGYRGLNVTYPFKQAVIPHLDELSQDAQLVGAVNTIVFGNGRRIGHNTDCWGFAMSFRQGLPNDIARERVLLLGAGGAGRAVAHALLDENVGRLFVLDPDSKRTGELVDILRAHFGPDRVVGADDAEIAAEVDGIVNASPVGMEKLPGCPLPERLIAPHHFVADIVYFPPETELIKAATGKGCAVLPGTGMALWQAVRAFELFTGKEPDISVMKPALLAASVPDKGGVTE